MTGPEPDLLESPMSREQAPSIVCVPNRASVRTADTRLAVAMVRHLINEGEGK